MSRETVLEIYDRHQDLTMWDLSVLTGWSIPDLVKLLLGR